MNLRPLRRSFTCCWDNTLLDKLNIFGLAIVSFFLTSVICWSCCLFYKVSSWFCFCFNLFLLIVFLFSWFFGIGLSFLFFCFYRLWNSSKNSASIGSSTASLLSVVASVFNEVNIGKNGSFVILSLSYEDLVLLLVSSSLFLLCNLKKISRDFVRFSWAWFQIFMLL